MIAARNSPPFVGNKEFANAVYEGPITERGATSYKFVINPGSRMLAMLRYSTRRSYDSEAPQLVFADGKPRAKEEELCRPPVKRACKEVKIKHQTLEEELSGRPNIELEK